MVDYNLGTVKAKSIVDITTSGNTIYFTYDDGTEQSFTISGGGTGSGESGVSVDSRMDENSTHPVQNKIIKKYVDDGLNNHTHYVSPDSEIYFFQGQGQYITLYQKIKSLESVSSSSQNNVPTYHASVSTQYGEGTKDYYGHVRVDDHMDGTSKNPVQNKVLWNYINGQIDDVRDDCNISVTSEVSDDPAYRDLPIQSKGVYNALQSKVNVDDANYWEEYTSFTRGHLYFNETTQMVDLFYTNPLFPNSTGWNNKNLGTLPEPFRPKQEMYCDCSNFVTKALLYPDGIIKGLHSNNTQTGLTFHVMYHYEIEDGG